MGRYLKLDDGTVWPRPALESDDNNGPAWQLTYAPQSMTREDQLLAASIISAYGVLVTEPWAAKALPRLRRTLLAERAR